jgi:hypothetical protein
LWITPAMAAGVTDHVWEIEEILAPTSQYAADWAA